MTTYQQTANSIIGGSIKSAIFIDDRALEFFGEKSAKEVSEETLSVDLFNSFKEHGVSLTIHKFQQKNIDDEKLKRYLFADRDLVLLDWKLDGETGEDKSLKLLTEVVNSAHIHFCAVYTSVDTINEVFDNIVSYFSGKDKAYYKKLLDDLLEYDDLIEETVGKVDFYNKEINGKVVKELIGTEKEFLTKLKVAADTTDVKCALIRLKIAKGKALISETANPEPELISKVNNTFVINNTIITLLKKEPKSDPKDLIERLANQVSASSNSFTQLLGLEMQNIFSQKGAFVDSNLFKVSKETLAFHRNKIMSDGSSDVPFTQMMKSVLLEHASLSLSSAKLSILDASVMDEIRMTKTDVPPDDELAHMNVFYNSLILDTAKKLNFGDVFVDSKKDYYMCITALCDCFRPEKIKNIYYFVKGTAMKRELALKLGDTAFINFLNYDQAVVWSNIDEEKDEKELARFQPVYIKPVTYQVKDFRLADGEILVTRVIHNEAKYEDGRVIGQDLEFVPLKYVTTIKPTYTQRVANHAFAHPMRVGVDFVRKETPSKAVIVSEAVAAKVEAFAETEAPAEESVAKTDSTKMSQR